MIEETLKTLKEWDKLADSEEFVKIFCPEAWSVTQISWDCENMRIVYILGCGQHVANSFKIEEWLKFLLDNSQNA